VDVKLTDRAEEVDRVAANWAAFFDSHRGEYDPSTLARAWYFVADTQYANSLSRLVTFRFGKSMLPPHDPVGRKIWDAVKVSVWLMLFAELFVYLIAVPSGVLCAVRRGKWQDRLISLGLFLLYSIPVVLACMLFLTFLCYGKPFKLFPMYGQHSENWESFSSLGSLADYAWHVFLPVLCMSVFSMAGLAMYSRTSMLDVVNQDYIRTARAKGLPERTVVLKHALRNALIPVITLFSNFLPALLGGSVIVEWLFGIPGMGRLSFTSIQEKDYNTLMALIYIDAIVVMASILVSDLLYVIVDPRISFQKGGGGE
jgi:peptide/nickel transport system permease protein